MVSDEALHLFDSHHMIRPDVHQIFGQINSHQDHHDLDRIIPPAVSEVVLVPVCANKWRLDENGILISQVVPLILFRP